MSEKGILIINAYTSNARLPVEGAVIAVTTLGTGGLRELVAIRETDKSGKSEPLTIETPDISVSRSPSGEPVSTLVNAVIQHPLYGRIIMKNIQIFPETVTLQDFQLIPLAQAPSVWNQTEVYDTPPQSL